MLLPGDIVTQSIDALKAHKMRAALTTLGLMMGVTTLITVMTIVEGANSYVEEKIANLGTNVFQIAKTPFATTDFNMILKALKYRRIDYSDFGIPCRKLPVVRGGGRIGYDDDARSPRRQRSDGRQHHRPNLQYGYIDTRTIELGRFFTPTEESRSATVCLIGENLRKEFFEGMNPIGKSIRFGNADYTIVGVYQPIGAVLGQNQDNFAVIPMTNYLRLRGSTTSLTLNIRAVASGEFDAAMDEARALMRARRHVFPGRDEDFFIKQGKLHFPLAID